MAGMIAFRPAATFRRMGSDLILPVLNVLGLDLSEIPKLYKARTSKPGSLKLGVEDIEWVTCGIRFGRAKNNQGDDFGTFIVGGLTVRTAAPFDWLAFLRQWQFGFDQVQIHGRVYYKLTGPFARVPGPNACVCLLDDRTAVFDEEKPIRTFLGRDASQPPAHLRSPDWERASRGLLAVALNNEDGAVAKQCDMGRADDAIALSLFKDVDRVDIRGRRRQLNHGARRRGLPQRRGKQGNLGLGRILPEIGSGNNERP